MVGVKCRLASKTFGVSFALYRSREHKLMNLIWNPAYEKVRIPFFQTPNVSFESIIDKISHVSQLLVIPAIGIASITGTQMK